jgi:hypothetical protein
MIVKEDARREEASVSDKMVEAKNGCDEYGRQ